ncbi:unnamed protein product [Caenorhabditis angaria]|uniref:Uncharacterized protein n=1 Tax=Caenorhabditis angaria TaxID=860376 RepID=A0A9P1IBG7_9PELO|nr:unnamed protein product [Caenorhabditis angaria]
MDSSDVLLLKNENIIWNYIFNTIVLNEKQNVVNIAFFAQFLKSNILPDSEPDEHRNSWIGFVLSQPGETYSPQA